MSEGKKKTIIFTQEVWTESAKAFRIAVTEIHGKTYGHMVVETSIALKERAEKLKSQR